MANKTANVYARVEPALKMEAERILASLGITPSSAIQMFYRQIVLQKGIPFNLKVPEGAVEPIVNVEEGADEEQNFGDLRMDFDIGSPSD